VIVIGGAAVNAVVGSFAVARHFRYSARILNKNEDGKRTVV